AATLMACARNARRSVISPPPECMTPECNRPTAARRAPPELEVPAPIESGMRGITSLACVLHAIVISAAAHAGAPSREVLRLPLTIERNNPVTTIGIAGRDIPIIVDTGGGVLALTRETL